MSKRSIDPRRRRELTYQLLARCMVGVKEQTESIESVSRELGISRSFAHGLLQKARGKVRVTAVLRPRVRDELEVRLLVHLRPSGFRTVRVIPTLADDSSYDAAGYRGMLEDSLGAEAASYVADELPLPKGAQVCVGGGASVISFAQHLEVPHYDLLLRPLFVTGSWLYAVRGYDATGVLYDLHRRLTFEAEKAGQSPPRIEQEVTLHESRLRDRAFPAVAVTALGYRRFRPSREYAPHPLTSPLVRMVANAIRDQSHRTSGDDARLRVGSHWKDYDAIPAHLYQEANQILYDTRVAAEVFGQPINANGEERDLRDEDRAFGITHHWYPLGTVQEWVKAGTRSILLAGGSRLKYAFEAAAATKCFNIAIVDTALACQLLSPQDRPPLYRDIPVLREPGIMDAARPEDDYAPPK